MSLIEKVNKFFPIPKILNMSGVGLDISDRSIKYAEVYALHGALKIRRYGEKKIPTGIMEKGKIVDSKRMSEILSSLAKELSISFARVSLPEEQLYIYQTKIPKISGPDARGSVELSLEEHIPIPALNTVFDFDLLAEEGDDYVVAVSAVDKETIESYLSVFYNSSLLPKSLELEAAAIARSVIAKGDKNCYMVVDFGDTRTGISIISSGVVLFTSTLEVGGSTLTTAIEKGFGISFEEAEKKKREYGLSTEIKNQEVFSMLISSIAVLKDEINRNFIYWHTHKDENGKDRQKIEKIILVGGDSNLKGLSQYLSEGLRIKVEEANVWINMGDPNKYVPEMRKEESLGYATAIGLALADF